MIIKAAKRIFNSDKICRSYSDLNFGVTFFGTQCIYHTATPVVIYQAVTLDSHGRVSDIIVVLCDVLIQFQQLLLLILLLYLHVDLLSTQFCMHAGTWHHFRTEKSAVTLFRVKTKTTLV